MQEAFRFGDDDVELASRVILGTVEAQLPLIYVTRQDDNTTALAAGAIDRLAFKLGGVAHVLVEPSRDFSKKLMRETGGRNPYGGTIAVCVSSYGVVRRYFLGPSFPDPEVLAQAIYSFSAQYVTNRRPRLGWEWQDLLEESTRQLRSKVKADSAEFEDWLENVDNEISEKDHEIQRLRDQLERLQSEGLETARNNNTSRLPQILEHLGPEIFRGEFLDRARYLVKAALDAGTITNSRTSEIAKKILENSEWSGGASKFEARVKQAGRDSSTADVRLSDILQEIGYERRQDGGHPVLVPRGLIGLSNLTLSTSPSDHRAGKNAAQEIIRDMGLRLLQD